MNRSIFTVSQVNNYVKNLMDRDLLLQNLWIEEKSLILNCIPRGICILLLKTISLELDVCSLGTKTLI